jgi:hypothetical protein
MNRFKNNFATTYARISLMLILLFGLNHLSAQQADTVKKWNFLVDVYLMFPNMNGETGIGQSLVLPVNANPGDIFSKLQMGGFLYLEAQTDKYAITSDIVYMNLVQEVTPGTILNSGEVDAKQFIWEFAGLYRLSSFLEIGIGGRLNYIQAGVDAQINVIPSGTEAITGRQSKTWFDPILIARFATDIKDKWLFQIRGDLGGFNIGSVYSWQLQGYAGYRFAKWFQLTAGYRILSTKYLSGEAPKEFIFNVNEFGPVVRLGFTF